MSLNINIYQELIDLANKPNFKTLLGVDLTFLSFNEEFLDVFLFGLGEGGVLLCGFLVLLHIPSECNFFRFSN